MSQAEKSDVSLPALAPTEELVLETPPPDLSPELDPESVVEEAEQLLREGAPHDFDVLIIGAGPGGLAAAQHLAQSGLQIALVEERELGGVCLNRGCIPTKTLLESIGVLRVLRRAKFFGIHLNGELTPDFAAMHQRKDEVVASLRAQTKQMLEEAGVEIINGQARFVEAHTLEIQTESHRRRVTAVHIIVAVGGIPARLPVLGADLSGVVTSDEILEQSGIPRRLVVAGAGAVGVEFASIFAELGASVTILEKEGAALAGEDEDIQIEMAASLREIGVDLVVNSTIERIENANGSLQVVFRQNNEEKSIETDEVLLATGRAAKLENLGLEQAGIEVESGKINVDATKQTSVGGVYAIGDCIRRVGWAHQAALEGREVADAILGVECEIDARFVPACYFTFPEVASVGLTLKAAHDLGIAARAGKFSFRANGRAATSGDQGGFVKIVIEQETGRLLGCQIIGPRATEIINEVSLALRNGATAESLTDALHAHPTFAEVLPGAARAALSGRET
ncbi:MAG TPA: dihydrolipoyl dehydrogenase [Abditibacterium sp.]|jgi:dihydrolipoamide dehydrogenase